MKGLTYLFPVLNRYSARAHIIRIPSFHGDMRPPATGATGESARR